MSRAKFCARLFLSEQLFLGRGDVILIFLGLDLVSGRGLLLLDFFYQPLYWHEEAVVASAGLRAVELHTIAVVELRLDTLHPVFFGVFLDGGTQFLYRLHTGGAAIHAGEDEEVGDLLVRCIAYDAADGDVCCQTGVVKLLLGGVEPGILAVGHEEVFQLAGGEGGGDAMIKLMYDI